MLRVCYACMYGCMTVYDANECCASLPGTGTNCKLSVSFKSESLYLVNLLTFPNWPKLKLTLLFALACIALFVSVR